MFLLFDEKGNMVGMLEDFFVYNSKLPEILESWNYTIKDIYSEKQIIAKNWYRK